MLKVRKPEDQPPAKRSRASKKSCLNCRIAHAACDVVRPCFRCRAKHLSCMDSDEAVAQQQLDMSSVQTVLNSFETKILSHFARTSPPASNSPPNAIIPPATVNSISFNNSNNNHVMMIQAPQFVQQPQQPQFYQAQVPIPTPIPFQTPSQPQYQSNFPTPQQQPHDFISVFTPQDSSAIIANSPNNVLQEFQTFEHLLHQEGQQRHLQQQFQHKFNQHVQQPQQQQQQQIENNHLQFEPQQLLQLQQQQQLEQQQQLLIEKQQRDFEEKLKQQKQLEQLKFEQQKLELEIQQQHMQQQVKQRNEAVLKKIDSLEKTIIRQQETINLMIRNMQNLPLNFGPSLQQFQKHSSPPNNASSVASAASSIVAGIPPAYGIEGKYPMDIQRVQVPFIGSLSNSSISSSSSSLSASNSSSSSSIAAAKQRSASVAADELIASFNLDEKWQGICKVQNAMIIIREKATTKLVGYNQMFLDFLTANNKSVDCAMNLKKILGPLSSLIILNLIRVNEDQKKIMKQKKSAEIVNNNNSSPSAEAKSSSSPTINDQLSVTRMRCKNLACFGGSAFLLDAAIHFEHDDYFFAELRVIDPPLFDDSFEIGDYKSEATVSTLLPLPDVAAACKIYEEYGRVRFYKMLSMLLNAQVDDEDSVSSGSEQGDQE